MSRRRMPSPRSALMAVALFSSVVALVLTDLLGVGMPHIGLAEAASARASLAAPASIARLSVELAGNVALPVQGQLSGASGTGAEDGSFAAWRGSAVTIGGTWDDTEDAQLSLWTIQSGGQWADWQKDLDIAVGAIYEENGETWAKAAAGAYDARWRLMLERLSSYWGSRPGTVYIRFAHEFNGDWTSWAVSGSEAADFVTTWRRFRALQKEIMPRAKLVFCPNDQSSGSLKLDWRQAFPGTDYVDVMSVDSYNQDPYVSTAARFRWKLNRVDSYGAPLGLERFRLFAESVGLPLAVSEWSSNADEGDGSVYVTLFAGWLHDHAGTGAGRIPYEILFNVSEYANGRFELFPTSRMRKAAASYASRF